MEESDDEPEDPAESNPFVSKGVCSCERQRSTIPAMTLSHQAANVADAALSCIVNIRLPYVSLLWRAAEEEPTITRRIGERTPPRLHRDSRSSLHLRPMPKSSPSTLPSSNQDHQPHTTPPSSSHTFQRHIPMAIIRTNHNTSTGITSPNLSTDLQSHKRSTSNSTLDRTTPFVAS
jgi:hypothetical protein